MEKKRKTNQEQGFIGHETEKLFKFISEFIIKRLVNVLWVFREKKREKTTNKQNKTKNWSRANYQQVSLSILQVMTTRNY